MPPRKTSTTSKKVEYNYRQINVKGDGNCFFRAIYKSAKDSGNLIKLVKCFLEDSFENFDHYNIHERDFIMDMREKLARSIESEQDGGQVKAIFENLHGFDVNDKEAMETYTLIVETLPSWISSRFTKPPKTLKESREAVCENIRRQGTYVSQIEIDIFKYINDTFCSEPEKHVKLNVIVTAPQNDINLSEINIINVGNIHYQYLARKTSTKQASSTFSAKTASSSSAKSKSTTLSSAKSSDSSDTKLSKALQKQLRKSNSSSKDKFEFLKSSSSSSSASSLSDETKDLMASFKEFVSKTKNKVGITENEKAYKARYGNILDGGKGPSILKSVSTSKNTSSKHVEFPSSLDDQPAPKRSAYGKRYERPRPKRINFEKLAEEYIESHPEDNSTYAQTIKEWLHYKDDQSRYYVIEKDLKVNLTALGDFGPETTQQEIEITGDEKGIPEEDEPRYISKAKVTGGNK